MDYLQYKEKSGKRASSIMRMSDLSELEKEKLITALDQARNSFVEALYNAYGIEKGSVSPEKLLSFDMATERFVADFYMKTIKEQKQKLKGWIPQGTSFINKATKPHLDKQIINEFNMHKDEEEYRKALKDTTFHHKYLFSFVELEDGTLVGFNENPSHGWSFPTAKWKT